MRHRLRRVAAWLERARGDGGAAAPSGNGGLHPLAGGSVAVAPGEVLGVAGESGTGKTLARPSVVGRRPDRSTARDAVPRGSRKLRRLRQRWVQWLHPDRV